MHRIGRDGRWQQFGTSCTLINALQWLHRPCSALSWIDRVDKKPSVKADLAIYSCVLGVTGQWVSVALTLCHQLDFSCCDNSVSFCKSSHIKIRITTAREITWSRELLLTFWGPWLFVIGRYLQLESSLCKVRWVKAERFMNWVMGVVCDLI